MRFGLSTHLYHGERLSRQHFETIRASGFDAVEVFATRTHIDYHDARHVDQVRGWLDELGVIASSVHGPICESFTHGIWGRSYSNASTQAARRDEAIAETRVSFDAARRLGASSVVVHLGLPRFQEIPPGDNDPGAVRRSIEALAQAAADTGVALALEVMPNPLSTPDALLDVLDELEIDAGICLDFGHAHLEGGAPEAAEMLSGHMITTHVHDNKGQLDNHLVPFEGTIDWAATLMAMSKVGYTGPLIFEVADHGDAAAVLARTVRARARLQAILKDLTAPLEFNE
ncbi:MAG TPA: sugar phosphate isomerase/epimerase family protein [Vicinamibacterales bacterium]|nr:sugar phosphate isomerase/epimerase family protein [Vicinamibacterales bacterium]